MPKRRDLLGLAILKYGEVGLLQADDQVVLLVHDGGMERYFIHLFTKNKYIAAFSGGSLSVVACVAWTGSGRGILRNWRRCVLAISQKHPNQRNREKNGLAIPWGHSIRFSRTRAGEVAPWEGSTSP